MNTYPQDPSPSFESLFEQMADLSPDQIEAGKLLALCDEQDIIDWLCNNKVAYLLIKTSRQAQRDAIIQFVEEEIYPCYSDQVENIIY
jgi:hypothetical protein